MIKEQNEMFQGVQSCMASICMMVSSWIYIYIYIYTSVTRYIYIYIYILIHIIIFRTLVPNEFAFLTTSVIFWHIYMGSSRLDRKQYPYILWVPYRWEWSFMFVPVQIAGNDAKFMRNHWKSHEIIRIH